MTMGKQGEIAYLRNWGAEGTAHAVNKPFSDELCGSFLAELGALLTLMPAPPAKLSDMGCGSGWTSIFFAKRGYDVMGLDIAEDMIKHANDNKHRAAIDNVRFMVGDYEQVKFLGEFNCVVFFDSLHHSVDEKASLRAAYDALLPGGICIASEPGTGHAKNKHTQEAVQKFAVTEKDMPPRKLIKLGKEIGFRKYHVYPHQRHLMTIIYQNHCNRKLLNILFRWDWIRYLIAYILMNVYKGHDGIIVLEK